MATAGGYLLPTIALRWTEQRSRAVFAGRLRVAALASHEG